MRKLENFAPGQLSTMEVGGEVGIHKYLLFHFMTPRGGISKRGEEQRKTGQIKEGCRDIVSTLLGHITEMNKLNSCYENKNLL